MRSLLGKLSNAISAYRQPSRTETSRKRLEDLLWLYDCICVDTNDSSKCLDQQNDVLESVSARVQILGEEMLEQVATADTSFNFTLSVLPSSAGCGAGDGLFIENGMARVGDLVAFYPGTVFYAEDIDFFGGIDAIFPKEEEREHFILRGDGVLLDGQKKVLDLSLSDVNSLATSDGGDVESM